jgi:hypothetical protein
MPITKVRRTQEVVHSPTFAYRVLFFFPLFDGWHMAKFHVLAIKL